MKLSCCTSGVNITSTAAARHRRHRARRIVDTTDDVVVQIGKVAVVAAVEDETHTREVAHERIGAYAVIVASKIASATANKSCHIARSQRDAPNLVVVCVCNQQPQTIRRCQRTIGHIEHCRGSRAVGKPWATQPSDDCALARSDGDLPHLMGGRGRAKVEVTEVVWVGSAHTKYSRRKEYAENSVDSRCLRISARHGKAGLHIEVEGAGAVKGEAHCVHCRQPRRRRRLPGARVNEANAVVRARSHL